MRTENEHEQNIDYRNNAVADAETCWFSIWNSTYDHRIGNMKNNIHDNSRIIPLVFDSRSNIPTITLSIAAVNIIIEFFCDPIRGSFANGYARPYDACIEANGSPSFRVFSLGAKRDDYINDIIDRIITTYSTSDWCVKTGWNYDKLDDNKTSIFSSPIKVIDHAFGHITRKYDVDDNDILALIDGHETVKINNSDSDTESSMLRIIEIANNDAQLIQNAERRWRAVPRTARMFMCEEISVKKTRGSGQGVVKKTAYAIMYKHEARKMSDINSYEISRIIQQLNEIDQATITEINVSHMHPDMISFEFRDFGEYSIQRFSDHEYEFYVRMRATGNERLIGLSDTIDDDMFEPWFDEPSEFSKRVTYLEDKCIELAHENIVTSSCRRYKYGCYGFDETFTGTGNIIDMRIRDGNYMRINDIIDGNGEWVTVSKQTKGKVNSIDNNSIEITISHDHWDASDSYDEVIKITDVSSLSSSS